MAARRTPVGWGGRFDMFTARKKILKDKGEKPDDFEESVAQALFDLEATNTELKVELRDLYITGARKIDLQGTSRKAVIIHVPYRLLGAYHKIQHRLVGELEKKFSGKDLVNTSWVRHRGQWKL